MPTAEYLLNKVLAESSPFYPWYRLCPVTHDVITVDTRPGEKFLVDGATGTASFDRWRCHVWHITANNDGVLTLGQYFQWTIVLPGY